MAPSSSRILLAVTTLLAAVSSSMATNLDVTVLSFALNLEYLEANFYSCAAYGHPLNASLSGGGPTPLGCKKALLSPMAQKYAEAIAVDEMLHVALLRSALGASSFAQPLINIGAAFEVAANVALNTTLAPPYDAYGSDILFFQAAFIFEDVGVTAYKGAANLLTSPAILEVAAGILAVEAYHAGAIRSLLLTQQNQTVFPYGAPVKAVVAAISALRAAVSGAADDKGIVSSNGSYIVAPVDANAIAFSRNVSQVLAVVYLGGATSGGFFPMGLASSSVIPATPPPVAAKADIDVAILQFALNLEYLEANFYSCAAYGYPLNASMSGGGPTPMGCMKALLSPVAQKYAEAIAMDEMLHVAFLRKALGASAFPQPLLNIGTAFEAAANAALNTTLAPPFDAYGNDILFYHAAFIFEDVGVTAYKGAANLLTNPGTLEAAAGILAVEGYHGGVIRSLLLCMSERFVFPYGAPVKTVVAAISALRATVSGAADDMGIIGTNDSYIIAPADANAVAFSRNVSQVLAIVTLGGVTTGGFFPNGLGPVMVVPSPSPSPRPSPQANLLTPPRPPPPSPRPSPSPSPSPSPFPTLLTPPRPPPPSPANCPCVAVRPDLDVAVLQFALNLEYLEANFYSCAAYGYPLNASLSGGGPAPLGCMKALLSPVAQQYAEAIARDEMLHVALLRSALGASAFPQPLINIGTAFEVAANVALNMTLSPPFNAYASDVLFYHAAFIFEDVGVTAYKGAARLLTNLDTLEVAAGILAVEGYHAGSIRTLLLSVAYQFVSPYAAQVKDIVAAISALRASVSGAADDQGIIGLGGSYIIAPGDNFAVAFSRSTSQVLNIVFLGGVGKGGFFPNGIKGTITTQ